MKWPGFPRGECHFDVLIRLVEDLTKLNRFIQLSHSFAKSNNIYALRSSISVFDTGRTMT